jgi:hypothetical protein
MQLAIFVIESIPLEKNMLGFFGKKKKKEAEEIKPVAPEERRIYILDFDSTITVMHTGGLAYGNDVSNEHVRKNIKDGFEDFIHKVLRRGHVVYIASYNDDSNMDSVDDEDALSGHALIKFYMDLAFGQDQKIFTVPNRNETGEIVDYGNIVSVNSQDLKQHHFDVITKKEGLNQDNPEDMKRIYIIEDDEDITRFFMDKGCKTLVPYSASRSADTAATNTLFTSYMPESFTN